MNDRRLIIQKAHPKRNVKCICFQASAALVAAMLALGIPVRVHPLHSDRLVVPSDKISNSQFRELIERHDFVFLSSVVFFTTGSSGTIPIDWTSTNTIETIGGGGSGASGDNNFPNCTGGGGAGYSKISNLTGLTPGGSVTIQVGVGGTAVASAGFRFVGVAGGDTWFNGANLAASSVGSKGGSGGNVGTGGTNLSGGQGGQSSGGVAPSGTKFSGGDGGATTGGAGPVATGGGGAAGPNGAGNNGVSSGSNSTGTNGGSGDAGSGGSAGAGNNNGPGGAGGNGAEWTTAGSGGGGGGGQWLSNTIVNSAGGSYGGGGGGASAGFGTATSGAGFQGIIVATYTPAVAAFLPYTSPYPSLLAQ